MKRDVAIAEGVSGFPADSPNRSSDAPPAVPPNLPSGSVSAHQHEAFHPSELGRRLIQGS